MRFVVATYGTDGDARPFAGLCRGLMDAGHEARLLADAATLGNAQALGVPTTALAGDIRGLSVETIPWLALSPRAAASTRPHARWRRSPTRMPSPGCAPLSRQGKVAMQSWRGDWPGLSAFPRPNIWVPRASARIRLCCNRRTLKDVSVRIVSRGRRLQIKGKPHSKGDISAAACNVSASWVVTRISGLSLRACLRFYVSLGMWRTLDAIEQILMTTLTCFGTYVFVQGRHSL